MDNEKVGIVFFVDQSGWNPDLLSVGISQIFSKIFFHISYGNMDGNEKLSGCVGESGILDGNEEYMLLSGGQHSGFASAVPFCGAYTPEKQYREQDRQERAVDPVCSSCWCSGLFMEFVF